MKKISFSILALIVVLSIFTTAAVAQNRVLGRANIPFSFSAHGQSFEAGAYELRQMGAQIVRLQQVETRRGVTLLSAQNIADDDRTTLVFRNDGADQILTAVIAPSYQISVTRLTAEGKVAVTGRTTTVALKH